MATYTSATYNAAQAANGAGLVAALGLVDSSGTELTGGAYARIADTPTVAGAVWQPSADHEFSIPAGATVGGWRAYDALSAGNELTGADVTAETYSAAGTYQLIAADCTVTAS